MSGCFSLPIRIHGDPQKIAADPVLIYREEASALISRHVTMEDFGESLLDFFKGVRLKLRHGPTVSPLPNQV